MSERHEHIELSQSAPVTEALNAHTLSRRGFLVIGGGALLATGVETASPALLGTAWAAETPSYTLDLTRAADMAQLRFDFFNLVLSTATSPPQLVVQDASKIARVLVTFPSQHLMEQPVLEPPPPTLPAPGTLHTKAVGESRIGFTIPNTVKSFPFTEDGLFGWWQWVLKVAPRALPPSTNPDMPTAPDPRPPDETETDLLLVDWLHLSPDHLSTWAHSPRAVTHGTRTELWHTKLTLRRTDGKPDENGASPTLRALDADQFAAPFVIFPSDAPDQIVQATTGFGPGAAHVKPVRADLVLLSSMGSSVDLDGRWESPSPIALWQHKSSIGRDNYVRIEQRGYLFPFGHRAMKISETRRRIENGVAYLFKRTFIVVKEPVKTYPGLHQPTNSDRRFPYRTVQVATLITPLLPDDPPDKIEGSPNNFWIKAGQPPQDVPFVIKATDWVGRENTFSCSLAFIALADSANASGGALLGKLLTGYSAYADLEIDRRRAIPLNGQKVAFAPESQADDTSYPTATLFLGAIGDPNLSAADQADLQKKNQPNFFPQMLGSNIKMPAVAALAGNQSTYAIAYDPAFVENGLATGVQAAAAKGSEMFARVQSNIGFMEELLKHVEDPNLPEPFGGRVTAAFPAENVGGLAVPNLEVGGLSRSLGPLSGNAASLTEIQKEAGKFDPSAFFPPEAKLLGDLSIADILPKDLTLADGGGGPTIVTTLIYPNGDKNQLPETVLTTLDWKPKLKETATGPFVPTGLNGAKASLTLHGEFRTELSNGKSTYKIHGELRDFTLNLIIPEDDVLDFIALIFNRFTFDAHNDAKPTIDPDIAKVEFRGPLSFVNTLQKFLQTSGKGPALDLQPSGVTVSYTLPIPGISVGVFSLQNLSFSAGLTLPFNGDPVRARFAFCSREQKFLVGVYVFAGGGFFALELGPDGLKMMEAAIEFGGHLGLDLVIASGSVTVMAGLYFKMEDKNGNTEITLTGYLRATGRVSVLGIITITAEFYLGLTYKSEGNIVEGEASLTVSIDILFFSTSVTLRVRKQFAGPASSSAARTLAGAAPAPAAQPRFKDLMSASDWNTYCDSFAA